ncbi:universal stress protein [Nocardioides sp. LHG3406-4]|uniref:universal stress protein n=1 Tax=Nocardioides sp. LHG3406-4 TaxID=2804575 RepID=UPI003CFA21E9
MHVVIAVDGSRQSLLIVRKLKDIADPSKVTDVSLVAVVRPLAAVGFADELSEETRVESALSFRNAAERALEAVAKELDGWGPKVHQRIRSGSPAAEIVKAAERYAAGLVVVGAGGGGLSVGSTAQRVQHHAPCPVLVVRPAPRQRKKGAARR